MRTPLAILLALTLTAGCRLATPTRRPAAPPPPLQILRVDAMDTVSGLDGSGTITVAADRVEGEHAVRWEVPKGSKHGLNLSFAGRGIEAADWDELRFRYRILTPHWTWFGIKLCDYPLADGMQATWRLDPATHARAGAWQEAVIDLHQPMYRWGERPDTQSQWLCFRTMSDGPAAVLLDDVRLARAALRIRCVEPMTPVAGSSPLRFTAAFEVANRQPLSAPVRIAVDLPPGAPFEVGTSPSQLRLDSGGTGRFTVILSVLANNPPLEPLSMHAASVRIETGPESEPVGYTETVTAVAPLPPRPSPGLLLSPAAVEAIKAKAAACDWAKEELGKVVAAADDWLPRKVVIPDRGGQWWHWYSCKVCGTRLKTISPTRHQCPSCGKVYTGEPYDSVPINSEHSKLAHAVETLGLAYQFTGRNEYAAKAAEILLGYAAKYKTYPRHNIHGEDRVGGGRVGPQTLDESTWLIPVVSGYDLVKSALDETQQRRIEDELLRPAAELIMEHRMGIHNIQCWKNSAVGLVGLCLNEPRFINDAVNSEHGIRAQLAKGILQDGFWYEGSWSYHYYTMSALWPLAEALRHAGLDVYTEAYRRFYAAPLAFALPDGRLPSFNDAHESNAYGPWTRYELAYARWHDPVFGALLRHRSRHSRESLLFGEAALAEDAELPTGSRNFETSGYAYLHCDPGKNGPVTILDYGPHGGGHGHPEKLQMLFYARNEIVAPDPGCIAYGVPLHREWYRQTISHNTVTRDGRSQQPCEGKLLGFAATPAFAWVRAAADQAYPGTEFTRTVVLLSGGLAVDLTEVRSDAPHVFDWAFHCYGNFQTELPLDPKHAPPGKDNGYEHLRRTRGCDTETAPSGRWDENGNSVAWAMAAAPGTTVFAGDGHGQPPTRDLPTVIVRRQVPKTAFCSAFALAAEHAPVPRVETDSNSGTCVLVSVEAGTDRLLLLLRRRHGETTAGNSEGPLQADGQGALVRWRQGRLLAAGLLDGTKLDAEGISVNAGKPSTVSIRRTADGHGELSVAGPGPVTIDLSQGWGGWQTVAPATRSGAQPQFRSRGAALRIIAEPGEYRLTANTP